MLCLYLWRDLEGPVGDVEVPYYEDEESHGEGLSSRAHFAVSRLRYRNPQWLALRAPVEAAAG